MDGCRKIVWNQRFKINRDSFDGKAKHRQPTQYNVFTDGSKIDQQTGTGLVIYKGTKEINQNYFRLPDGTTVFQAEVTAIAKAAETLVQMNLEDMKYVKIFVDS